MKDSGNQKRRELTKHQGRTTAEAKDREWTKDGEKERQLKTKTEIMEEGNIEKERQRKPKTEKME